MKIKICYFAVLFTVAPKQWNATGTGRWVSQIVVYYLYFSDETESVSAQNSTYSQNSRVFVSRYLGFLREGEGGGCCRGMYVSILNFNSGHFMYWREGHVFFDISLLYLGFSLWLSQFPTHLSCCLLPFHLTVLCCYFKAMWLVRILPQEGLHTVYFSLVVLLVLKSQC